ncbi:MFS transporter [Alicyclobacillus cycloheptanicus]|uniref:EmrB/QacA subfamily drug resistance transporter n=1 Tax=Alicyclobacillus cycloheptanicus TaxID=1457 RepID=A0ABT9XHG6_9BACL|nr:MDR family MFS transporter [Alicyclobacillus cycloheptanicus]MDQ0189741.1 EmrB/QacA subfamily drug resistance transporter [Alicyclobacillus cycloheptanicus]WDM01951.1 MFS transporter [Alicyclobacillus cycloheptanicus]
MEAKQTRLGLVVTGLLLGIFVSSMDNTIVATATGNIVAHLGGIDKILWITAGYLMTEMSGMPIFGKLSDMYGRKRFYVFGIAVFLLGSILCGTAQNMDQLALYRAIQGVGGGALMPIAFTIIFDVVPPQQMGKFSGMFGAVFGVSSIVGPLLGSYITDHFGWRWVFYINVPAGIVTLILVAFFYHESRRHVRQVIDWFGVVTLVPAIVCLTFSLEFGGNQYAWNSVQIIGGFLAAALLFAAFAVAEAKAKEPIVSFSMFRNRVFAGANFVGVMTGAAFVVAVVYIPIYVQGVRGGSAVNAGLELLPMMLGSSITAPLGGQLASRLSYRAILFPACLVFSFGIYLLTTLTPDSSTLQLMAYMAIVGLGIGPSFSVGGMAAMSEFDARDRGAASSTNSFIRELGMTIGIVILGVLQKNVFQQQLKTQFAGMARVSSSFANMDPRAILLPQTRAQIPGVILSKLVHALSTSVTQTMVWDLIPAILSVVLVFWMGGGRFRQPATQPAQSNTDAG